jgi:hypothetical protein
MILNFLNKIHSFNKNFEVILFIENQYNIIFNFEKGILNFNKIQ